MTPDEKETLLAEFAGFLSGDVPELRGIEVPRLRESVDRFLTASAPAAPETVTVIYNGSLITLTRNDNGGWNNALEIECFMPRSMDAALCDRIAELERERDAAQRALGARNVATRETVERALSALRSYAFNESRWHRDAVKAVLHALGYTMEGV